MYTELTAWANNEGVTVFRTTVEDGFVREQTELADWPVPDADNDLDKAEALLESNGYRLIGAWTRSGESMASIVERATPVMKIHTLKVTIASALPDRDVAYVVVGSLAELHKEDGSSSVSVTHEGSREYCHG